MGRLRHRRARERRLVPEGLRVLYPSQCGSIFFAGKDRLVKAAQAELEAGRARLVLSTGTIVIPEDLAFHVGFDPRTAERGNTGQVIADRRWHFMPNSVRPLEIIERAPPDVLVIGWTVLVPPEYEAVYLLRTIDGRTPIGLYRGRKPR
jgi:hypothetical protein